MKLIFKEKRQIQGGVTEFVFTPNTHTSWTPGQYVHITLPHDDVDDRGDERWFTIVSAPFEKDIAIATRIATENGSSFKNKLMNLSEGDEVEADEPSGSFTVNDLSKNYIFVAGSIGITPFRSMLAQMNNDKNSANIELLYANRDESTEAFKDELEALANGNDWFKLVNYYGDNHIDETALRQAGNRAGNAHYYVSGPEPMVDVFKQTLIDMGVAEDHMKFDYFPGYPGV